MRAFAVVPAAGASRRMGRPKLMLPVDGRPLITHLLHAWREAGADAVVVVARRDDQPLIEACRAELAEVVTPEAHPPDMRASVQHALRWLAERRRPTAEDYWLLAPADMPRLRPEDLRQVLAAAAAADGRIVVPVHQGRRGHPAAFPWPLADEALRLPSDQGLNQLLARHAVTELPSAARRVLQDVDTPEDYRRLT